MQIARTLPELQHALADARRAHRRIGFVPTMGWLHEGHLSLCDIARVDCDVLVLSIFVNPLQFGPTEDLARYPRDLERDTRLAEPRGVDLIYAPGVEDMYPHGEPAVRVTAPGLADRLCGAYRPGHFDGVLTVVAKLFERVQPALAVFGQKDLQQAALIQRMVADLDLPVEIRVAPIVRESDGLAMSSRNVYLSPEERREARALSRALAAADRAFRAGERRAHALVELATDTLRQHPGIRVQYIQLVDVRTLEPVQLVAEGNALALAAFAGSTRLIDNHVFGTPF